MEVLFQNSLYLCDFQQPSLSGTLYAKQPDVLARFWGSDSNFDCVFVLDTGVGIWPGVLIRLALQYRHDHRDFRACDRVSRAKGPCDQPKGTTKAQPKPLGKQEMSDFPMMSQRYVTAEMINSGAPIYLIPYDTCSLKTHSEVAQQLSFFYPCSLVVLGI